MRIQCRTIEDFIENLRSHEVHDATIYVERTLVPCGDKTPRDATSFDVSFCASTVVNIGEDGQALLSVSEECGIDRLTADGNKDGTAYADSLREQLQEYCQSRELKILPGSLDM